MRKLNVKEQRVADTFPGLWETVLGMAEGDTRRLRVLSIAKVEVYPIPYIEWRNQQRRRRSEGRRTHSR